MKCKLLTIFLIVYCFAVKGQQIDTNSIQTFASDIKKLISINSSIPDLIDLSGKEAENLFKNATIKQIIQITKPYLNSNILNSKMVCFALYAEVFTKKAKMKSQKQELTEILCKNYLNSDHEIQVVHNILEQRSEKDFTLIAKKYIEGLLNPMLKYPQYICAKIVAVAQIKEGIPHLWRYVNKNIETMTTSDIDILASLARLGENRAGLLLCKYYNYQKNRTDYRYIFSSRNLAFSLDSNVLKCMIEDFKTLDLSVSFRESDSGFYPAGYLAENICAMLKNYPYTKSYNSNAKILLTWLTEEVTKLELEQK
jgi:hypothetical protein